MWLSVFPQIILAALLLLAPGLIISLALRFKFLEGLFLAPALSVGVLVLTSTATPLIGVDFGPAATSSVTAFLAGLGYWLTRSTGSFRADPVTVRPPTGGHLISIGAFGIAAGLIAWRTTQMIGTPTSFSQTYDAIFHLNSVRFALDTGQSSSFTLGAMTGGGFYPAGWNAVATFTALVTSADVPLAVNITSIVLAAVFWPLSCLLMARWIAGQHMWSVLAAGIACASLGAFPFLMMDFGVLYPNLLAISVLPASIALAARLLRVSRVNSPRILPEVLALLLSLAGLTAAHPTTLVAWLVWTLPMVAVVVLGTGRGLWQHRRTNRKRFAALVYPVAGYCAVFVLVWIFLRPPEEAAFWGPYHTVPQALGEALLIAPMDLAPAWLVAPLAFLGLWAAFRQPRQYAWIAAVFVVFSGLFVVVSGFPVSPLRNFLTGVWYNDSYRVAALLPVVSVLLVAVGVQWAAQKFSRVAVDTPPLPAQPKQSRPKGERSGYSLFRVPAAVLVVICAIALGQEGGLQQEVNRASKQYEIAADSPLVSSDELAVIERLDETVPPGSVLVGNPYTGAALSYGLMGYRAAQLHVLSSVSPGISEIYERLDDVVSDSEVCNAVRDENAYFVLDFGLTEVHGGDHTPDGLRGLNENPGVTLIDSQGDAKLYEITACEF